MYIQMMIVGMTCLLSMISIILIYIIINYGIENFIFRLKSLDSIIEGILFMCVPICTSTFLLIHFSSIYTYVMYSAKIVVIGSILFLCTFEITFMSFEELFFKSSLSFAIISVMSLAFFIKKLHPSAYNDFQKKIEDENVYLPRRTDLIITIVLNIIFLTPTIIFILYFFSLLQNIANF